MTTTTNATHLADANNGNVEMENQNTNKADTQKEEKWVIGVEETYRYFGYLDKNCQYTEFIHNASKFSSIQEAKEFIIKNTRNIRDNIEVLIIKLESGLELLDDDFKAIRVRVLQKTLLEIPIDEFGKSVIKHCPKLYVITYGNSYVTEDFKFSPYGLDAATFEDYIVAERWLVRNRQKLPKGRFEIHEFIPDQDIREMFRKNYYFETKTLKL